MKINLTHKQYETLIKALETSSFVYGTLTDFVDEEYRKDLVSIESMAEDLLAHARVFNFSNNVEVFMNKDILKEEYYKKIFDDVIEYDEYITFKNLANKLGMRDFKEKYTTKEIEDMAEKSKGYLGVPLYDFEKKYYDEFNEYEYNRLYVKNKIEK